MAIGGYGDRTGRLSDEEKARLLKIFDTLVPTIPARPQRDVKAELADIRAARRAWGRKAHPRRS